MSTPSDAFSEQNTPPEEAPVEINPESPPETVTPEATLPPEAQGEANGGPLGCCLGVVVGTFLTLSLIFFGSVLLHNGGYLGFATIPIGVVGTILCGFLGWKIGKAIYHEYELSPQRRRRLEQLEHRYRNRR